MRPVATLHLRTFRKKEKYEAVLSLENTHRLWLPVSAALLTRETCLSFVTTKGNFADEDVMEITSMRVTSWRILSVHGGPGSNSGSDRQETPSRILSGEWWEKQAGGAADAANFFPQDAESNQKGDWYNLEKCVKACLNMRGQLRPKWLDGSSTETAPNFGIAWVELSWEFHYKRRKTCSTHTRRLTISTSKDTELRPP